MNLIIYEDSGYSDLYPASLTRPVYAIRFGMCCFEDRIRTMFPEADVAFHCRSELEKLARRDRAESVNRFAEGDTLFVNGRLVCYKKFVSNISSDESPTIFTSGDSVAAAYFPAKEFEKVKNSFAGPIDFLRMFPEVITREVDANFVRYIWECVDRNGEQLAVDFREMQEKPGSNFAKCDTAHYLNEKNIYISENSLICPDVVVDASDGPIYIDDGAIINSFSVLYGPLYIGKGTVIKAGSRIYGGTSIGPACKIGGEVSQVIVQGYSNKQHDGFLGNAYLGEWVNLGAGTNNSDLKNNYKNVVINLGEKRIDTGLLHAGLYMGDHSKTAINSMLNTGTVVGVHCNLFGSGFMPKNIPSFSWGGSSSIQTYKLQKALETARLVTSRRGVEFADIDEDFFKEMFENLGRE